MRRSMFIGRAMARALYEAVPDVTPGSCKGPGEPVRGSVSTSAPTFDDVLLHRAWQRLSPEQHAALLVDDEDLAVTPHGGTLAPLQYSLVERLPERGHRLTGRGRRVVEWGAALVNGIVREPTPRDLWDLLDDEDREVLAEGDRHTERLERLDLLDGDADYDGYAERFVGLWSRSLLGSAVLHAGTGETVVDVVVWYPVVQGHRRIVYLVDGTDRREASIEVATGLVSGDMSEIVRAALSRRSR